MIPVGISGAGPAVHFLRVSASKLQHDFLPRLDKALAVIPEDQMWVPEGTATNSVGNILLHMEGNLRQWVIAGVGGEQDVRIRPHEFSATGVATKHSLLATLTATVGEACSILAALPPEELSRTRCIQVYDVTGLEAIFHAVEHFSYHLGQVIHIAKRMSGSDLRLYPF